jgi:hypothetical protein
MSHGPIKMDYWQPIETLPETSETDIHGLLWGRLHVSGTEQKWITDWKVLKASWIHWLGGGVNGSPRRGENWYVQGSGGGLRVDRVEATHWMPLPAAPASQEEQP